MKVVTRLVAGIVTVLIGVWLNYLCMPAWNFSSLGMWAFLLVMFVIGAILFGIAESMANDNSSGYAYFATLVSAGLAGLTVIILIVGGLTSAQIFRASSYHNIVTIDDASFEEDIPKVTELEIPIVDVETAQKVGDRKIGGIENAPWYEVDDEYNLIKYQGEFYRISELNYGDFWKYRKAKHDGIPGYVMVNSMTQEAKYIELEEPIKYSPSAHYSYLLKRHLRNQYPSYMFGTSFFEIDEEGNPYYITSVKNSSIGLFGGKKEESFIITNACNGDSKEYKTEDLPEWIDHAYDLHYLMKITNYHYLYVNGWWNSWVSKTDVKATSYQYRGNGFAGYNTAITSNGAIVFYTGVTPASNAESNIGFILASPRTGKINYYECAGAEESSAQQAAAGLVQNLGYYATFPTILNVDGSETYFMLLKDNAGLVQRYALCNIKDYTKVVQAEDFESALQLYREKLGINTSIATNPEEKFMTEGNIQNLYKAEIDGCTFYYFILEGSENLYMSSIKNSNKQVLLKEGTLVSVQYTESSEEGIFIVEKIQF